MSDLVVGLHACVAVAKHRPAAIQQVWYAEARKEALSELIGAARKRDVPCRPASEAELGRVAGSVHHEGVVVRAEPLRIRTLAELRKEVPKGVWLAVDGVENPHNLGAILRSAAWFGAKALILSEDPKGAVLPSAALRVAQGAAEIVAIAAARELAVGLKTLQRDGFATALADASGADLRPGMLKAPCVIVLGSEATGARPQVRAACSRVVRIPGTGAVESLNVSVAAGALLAIVDAAEHRG